MGTITRSFANNITTSGVLLPASLTNNSIANVTAYNASIATGNMVLISSQTASASASIIACVHGGVVPVCAQGSRETTIVAPCAKDCAPLIAITSAWSGESLRLWKPDAMSAPSGE